jgi:NADH-quinone oxidoreductase subunit E
MPVLTDELRDEAERIKARYPSPRSAMMPLLYLVQSVEGHVSREGMTEVGDLLGLTTAEVEAVATFYTMYRFRPTGRYVLAVCTNVSCALLGAKSLYDKAEELLGPNAHEMSDDGAITLHEEECLGACEQAPLIQVNWLNYANMTEENLIKLIDELRAGSPSPSSQGVVPPDLKTTCRILAGVGTPSDWNTGDGAERPPQRPRPEVARDTESARDTGEEHTNGS